MSHPIARMVLMHWYGVMARAWSDRRRRKAQYGDRMLTVDEFWAEMRGILGKGGE